MVMMMAMPVVVMAVVVVVMAVAVMVVAMPVMAMMAMSVMAVTAGEGLTRDRQRSSCQRQNSDSGRNDLLDPGHKHSPGLCSAGIALR